MKAHSGSWPLFAVIVSVLTSLVLATLFWSSEPAGSASASRDAPGVTASPAPSPGATGSSQATPEPTASAPDTPAPGTPAVPSEQVADDLVTSFLGASVRTDASATGAALILADVASGAIVLELANEQQELASNGWTRSGSPTLSSLTVLTSDLAASPPRVVVSACIDSSSVVTLDTAGVPVGATGQAQRFINVYTMENTAGQWRVTERSFPNDPAC